MSFQRTLITKPDGRRLWYCSWDRPPPQVEASASAPAAGLRLHEAAA